jgi:hypothetical protein
MRGGDKETTTMEGSSAIQGLGMMRMFVLCAGETKSGETSTERFFQLQPLTLMLCLLLH